MNWRMIILSVAGLLLVITLILGAYFLGASRQTASSANHVETPLSATAILAPSSPGNSTSSSDNVIPTSLPPLAQVDFPSEAIQYPPNWPDAIRYPSDFIVVEAVSGALPSAASQGWVAKLRYRGSPKNVADMLSSFFTKKGWQVEQIDLDTSGLLITIEKNNKKQTGALIIDIDKSDPNFTDTLATVRL